MGARRCETSYEVVEAGLRANLQTIAGLTVELNDFRKIQAGSPKFAIIKYEDFDQSRFSMQGDHHIVWTLKVELFCRYTNDTDTRNAMRDTRQAIIDRINRYPKLNGTVGVFDALVTRGAYVRPDAQDAPVAIGSIRYLQEDIFVDIEEELEVDYQE